MKREARDFRESMPRPVRRIPLEEGSFRRRAVGTALALLAAGLALFMGIRSLTRVDAGWAEIEADSADGPTGEVRLWAELGAGSDSPLTERRFLTGLYSRTARELYTLYTPYELVSGVRNLWWINHHPNEEISVDRRLYQSLRRSAEAGRWIFLGPVYEIWDGVYFSENDADARQGDPRLDKATGEALAEMMSLLRDENHISLSFPGEEEVRLNVSEELLTLAEAYGVSRYLDFGWMLNACLADGLADALTAQGWTRGVVASPDGFVRCLDARAPFTMNILATRGARTVQTAETEYQGPAALIQLVPSPQGIRPQSYAYEDGTLRTAWISPEDGLDHRPLDGLCVLSAEESCQALLLRVLPCLEMDSVSPEDLLSAVGEAELLSLSREGETVLYGND